MSYDLCCFVGTTLTRHGFAFRSRPRHVSASRAPRPDTPLTKIAFDLWNWAHLRPWLSKAGFSEATLDTVFVPFGQGYKSMSPAVRDLETLILERKLRHGGHPVLSMCIANSVIERGDAGNRKLSKKRSMGRIDGAVALVMAIGAAPAGWTRPFDAAALIG